jgi:tRNA threonylcarbamoyladenosine biosynthesis protein TsaE
MMTVGDQMGDETVDADGDDAGVDVTGAHRAEPAGLAELPITRSSLVVPTADAMRELGGRLVGLLRPGDLVVLSGDLGAGKTTLVQGLGAGMGVRGEVTSPTFVIARVHPSLGGGPALVHVDAYRLGSLAEVDDLDLDASLGDSITVVEWGEGLVEDLAPDRLELHLLRPQGSLGPDDAPTDGDEPRTVRLAGFGRRWAGVDLPDGER